MRNAVPFFQTPPAAAGCSVLCDEHRVAAKRRLFAVIGDDRRGEALGDEILGVGEYHGQAFALHVGGVFSPQVKAAAESRFGQGGEEVVKVAICGLENKWK